MEDSSYTLSDGTHLVVKVSSNELQTTANEELIEQITAFRCRLCQFIIDSKTEIINHIKDAHHVTVERHIYICGQCSLAFESFDDCQQHISNKHTEKPADPIDHKRLTTVPKNLEKYVVDSSSTKKQMGLLRKLLCGTEGCMHRFSTEGTLRYHQSCHTSDGSQSFKCSECGELFRKWIQCATHLWKSHAVDVDLYGCPDCHAYKAVSWARMQAHRLVHSQSRQYPCDKCGKLFKQLSQLRNHKVVHIDRHLLPTTSTLWYARKKCDLCQKIFSDAKCLKKHVQTVHSKLRPYVCHICGHTSARKAMLLLHQRQHTGEKPYSCNLCTYKTGDHNSLRRHKMRHTGERPYRCPHCSYAAIQSNSLKKHIHSQHPTTEDTDGTKAAAELIYHSLETLAVNTSVLKTGPEVPVAFTGSDNGTIASFFLPPDAFSNAQ